MALPLILGVTGLFGVAGMLSASTKNDKAKEIVKIAQEKYEEVKKEIENKHLETNKSLSSLGLLKVNIFKNEIKILINILSKCKQSNSEYNDMEYITDNDLKELKIAVNNSLNISSGLSNGVTAGVLTSIGAYSAVGLLGSASTGTAIVGLSGAAAESATLAWLGGGSLATGGGGIAMGNAVLGGIVIAPILLITGLTMDSQAEKNLTEARKEELKIEKEIELMYLNKSKLDAIILRVNEIKNILFEIQIKFNKIRNNLNYNNCNHKDFKTLMILGKTLKNLLDIPVIDKMGKANINVTRRIRKTLKEGNI